MTILKDVFKELFKMFVADLRLSLTALAGVALVASLIRLDAISPVAAGILLTVFCVAIMVEAVMRETSKRGKSR